MSAAETRAVTVVPDVLEVAVAETGLIADGAATLRDAYAPHFIEAQRLIAEAAGVASNQPKAARATRLDLRAVRVASDKTRKLLKEDLLRRGRAIDGINHVLEYQVAPMEERLEAIEKAEEIAEANRKEALRHARAAELLPFADPTHLDLANMPEAQWTMILAGAKAAHEAKLVAEAKAEAERVATEKRAAEEKAKRDAEAAAERERMRAENERLAKVAAEERAAREASEAKAKAEREEAERLLAIEREQARKDRETADAKARQEREAIERQAAAERAEADRKAAAAAELARKGREEAQRQAAEAKAEATRLAVIAEQNERHAAEAEQRARDEEAKRIADEQAKERAAAAAPDKAKLAAFASRVRALPVPALAVAGPLAAEVAAQVEKFAVWIETKAARL